MHLDPDVLDARSLRAVSAGTETVTSVERPTLGIIAPCHDRVRAGLASLDHAGRLVVINRQRRRLLLSSAAALAGSVGVSALSQVARAADQDNPPPPGAPSLAPIFAPKPAWLGTFSPTTINLSAPSDVALPPRVRSRESWAAEPPAQPYVPQTPKAVSLHHTGAYWNGKPGPEQYLRNIQHFHTGPQREWEDIAYHYLVDLDGVIWAGRPPTVRGNPSIYYDPTGLILISFLGDFGSQEPTEAQLTNAADTAAWLMKKYNMTQTTVTGHRDHAPTSCPGDHLYRLIQDGSFTKRVRESLSKLG